MKRVILLEDEEKIRRGLKTILEEVIGGFTVVGEADNGRRVMDLVERCQPDLVITDIRMPGVDGLEVLRAIRAARSDLPVIILSGHAEFDYAREALRLGARAYLLKPIDRAELARTLESLSAPEGEGNHPQAESNRVVREVKRLIADNLQTDLSLQGLADQVRLNSQYLSKLFKEETGENLTHCIARLRVEKARRLLETSHLRIYEIAELCGFGNVKRFQAVFKDIAGVTPSSLRKL